MGMAKMMAICDENIKCMNRLANILKERSTFPFKVCTYSDEEMLMEDILMGRLELVLISDRILEEKAAAIKRNTPAETMVIVLHSGRYVSSDYPSIWRYQSAEGIRKEILSIYSEKNGNAFDGNRGNHKTRMTCIYSPVKRTLQTPFSICLGQVCSEEEKCLYLNLQCFSGITVKDGVMQRDIADLIFYLRSGANRISLKLESMLGTIGNLDYIEPVKNFTDLLGITKEEWLLLIRTLEDSGVYDRLIVDISGETAGYMELLLESDNIYTIAREDKKSLVKLQQYRNALTGSVYDEILAKTDFVTIPEMSIDCEYEELRRSEMAAFVRKVVSGGVPSGVLADEIR